MCIIKEVFDAELYAIPEALDMALGERQNGRERPSQGAIPHWKKVYVWTDS